MEAYKTEKYGQAGFTLIELSIVIVIIGLIIGATLGGQQLIKQAEIRAALSQIEQYNTAANTFKGRYGGLPGDFRNSPTSLTGATGGDGDGLIEGGNATPAVAGLLGHEGYAFWDHLNRANLGPNVTLGAAIGTAGVIETHFPRFKMRDTMGIVVYNNATDGVNYYHIGITAYSGAGAGTAATNGLTPEEAYNIDLKADDGKPNSGRIVARGGTTVIEGAASVTDPGCTDGATAADDYRLTTTTQQCQLRVQFGM